MTGTAKKPIPMIPSEKRIVGRPVLEEGIVDTVRRGGDTDTNAAIAGALLGAAWGLQAVLEQWLDCILSCHPERG
jgi:ADP-ribosyl-[dinitrogen reductase] hydrolase